MRRRQQGVRRLQLGRDAATVCRAAVRAPVLLLLPAQPHGGGRAVCVPPVQRACHGDEARDEAAQRLQ